MPSKIDATHPYHVALEAAGHKLIRDETGAVDDNRLDIDDYESGGGHNGPECALCGRTWCIHCRDPIAPCLA